MKLLPESKKGWCWLVVGMVGALTLLLHVYSAADAFTAHFCYHGAVLFNVWGPVDRITPMMFIGNALLHIAIVALITIPFAWGMLVKAQRLRTRIVLGVIWFLLYFQSLTMFWCIGVE